MTRLLINAALVAIYCTSVTQKLNAQIVTLQQAPGLAATDFGNATVKENGWISSKKPSYSGPFGLWSFFNNSIEISKKDHTLEKGSKINTVEMREKARRNFVYGRVKYIINDEEVEGWIWLGRQPEGLSTVTADDPSDLPKSTDL